ncbi:unnamed protein product, partial [Musa textilis]
GRCLAEVHNSGTVWPRCTIGALFGRGALWGHCLAKVHLLNLIKTSIDRAQLSSERVR